jgi:N-formylglutamate amidohydrolase
MFPQPLRLLLLLSAAWAGGVLNAQSYTPGQSYLSDNGYIEYLAGELPLILAAPHGGELSPAGLPDRDCPDCVYVNDANTQDLARRIYAAIYARTGCYPHVIINRLSRRKLDANRDLPEAADGIPAAAEAWYDFHGFIDYAKAAATTNTDRALFIDLHGHGHVVQRLELGYLLFGSELRQPDAQLNSETFIGYSSIRQLAQDNLGARSHAQLIRGAESLGQLMADRGYRSVPSADEPAPTAEEAYFSGGYNTDRHGSRLGGFVDAIQIECNMAGVRDTPTHRQAFADSLAAGLEAYLQTHYFETFGQGFCTPTATADLPEAGSVALLEAFPNPAHDWVRLNIHEAATDRAWIGIYAPDGRLVQRLPAADTDWTPPGPGSYVIVLWEGARPLRRQWIVAR